MCIRDRAGRKHPVRILLDSGSQATFCTMSFARRIGLKLTDSQLPITGINNSLCQADFSTRVRLNSRYKDFNLNVHCAVLPSITNNLPAESFDISSLNIPKNIFLSDPQLNFSSQIDILLGAQYYLQLIEPIKFIRSPHFPIIQETKLGFILADNLPFNVDMTKPVSSFIACEDNNAISSQLKDFWQLEDVAVRTPSVEDSECESHFIANTFRNNSGRFVVSLPRRGYNSHLGDSLPGAIRRFQSLELKFKQNPALHKDYSKFMQEYLTLGHMSLLDSYDLSVNKLSLIHI